MGKINKNFLIILFFGLVLKLSAQVEFTASSNTNTVALQQEFYVTYTLKGGKAENFQRPRFDNFQVIGQSTRSGGGMTIIINNKVISDGSSEQSWTYTLLPTKPGTFTIDEAIVKVNGVTHKSNKLTITVINTNQPSYSQQQQPGKQQYSKPQQPQQTQPGTSSNISSEDVFITATANKKSAYIGEPILITYKIYTRVPISQYSISKLPSFQGFWAEELGQNKNPETSQEIINGQKYTTAIIRQQIVFPQQAGKLTIDALEVDAIVRLIKKTQRRSPFDSFFDDFFNDPFFSFPSFGTTYEDVKTTLKSNPVTIEVKPLPTANRPTSFNGQVGNYKIEAWFDKDRILLNDALTLNVKISGNGNLNLLTPPEVEIPQSFDRFEPQTQENITKTAQGISGSKTFSYLMIPREPGLFKIPPIIFSYFDPASATYKEIKTDAFEIEVVGQGGSVRTTTAVGKTQSDIRFIKLNPSKFTQINVFFAFSPLHYIGLILPLTICIALIVFLRKKMELYSDIRRYKFTYAAKTARKNLKKCENLLKNNKLDEFYIETSQTLWQYVSDRFSIPRSELTMDNIKTRLLEKGIDETSINNLVKLIEYCEFVRFAPGTKQIEANQLLTEAKNVIFELDKYFS